MTMRRDNPYNTTEGAREADRRFEQRERNAMRHERFAPPTQAALDHLADADAEALDDAAWAHARIRSYADSADELAFVRAYKAAVLDDACEDDSQAARDGWRAGRRHRAAPGPRDEDWREEQKAAARGMPL